MNFYYIKIVLLYNIIKMDYNKRIDNLINKYHNINYVYYVNDNKFKIEKNI